MSQTSTANALPLYFGGMSPTQSVTQIHRSYKIRPENLITLALSPTFAALAKLGNLSDNWDGRGSLKPDPNAVQHAMALVEAMFNQVCGMAQATGKPWIKPHVSSSEVGEVTLEWWRNTHKLTIYIGPENAEYIKVWGPNIATEMDDGALVGSQFQGLWLWLNA